MNIPFRGLVYEVTTMMHGQYPTSDGVRRIPCADLELNTAECYEAYGLLKGANLCYKFLEDVQECKQARLRQYRTAIMKEEKYKKILKGELPWSKRLGAPYKYDSFIQGTFIP